MLSFIWQKYIYLIVATIEAFQQLDDCTWTCLHSRQFTRHQLHAAVTTNHNQLRLHAAVTTNHSQLRLHAAVTTNHSQLTPNSSALLKSFDLFFTKQSVSQCKWAAGSQEQQLEKLNFSVSSLDQRHEQQLACSY